MIPPALSPTPPARQPAPQGPYLRGGPAHKPEHAEPSGQNAQRANAPHGQRQGIPFGAAQQAVIANGIDAREQTGGVHAVGLIHEALPRGLGKTLRHHGPAHHRHRAAQQVMRDRGGHFRQITPLAMQSSVLKGIDAVAELGHFGVVRHHDAQRGIPA